MYGYIYLTENLTNGKCYIGQHKSEVFDERYKGSGKLLTHAFDKYGWDNFICQPIEWCNSFEELNEREKYWINKTNAVESDLFYNLTDGGQGTCGFDSGYHIGMLGKPQTDYQKQRASEANKLPKSEIHKRHISESMKNSGVCKGENNPMYGKTNNWGNHTQEARYKISKSLTGKKHSKEHIEKVLKSREAKKDEINHKISETLKGHTSPIKGKHKVVIDGKIHYE